jgi:hypothetical protein
LISTLPTRSACSRYQGDSDFLDGWRRELDRARGRNSKPASTIRREPRRRQHRIRTHAWPSSCPSTRCGRCAWNPVPLQPESSVIGTTSALSQPRPSWHHLTWPSADVWPLDQQRRDLDFGRQPS